jgi:uncharacterized protein (TIGR03435 family)
MMALASIAVLLVAAGVAVKIIFFPAAKDSWFQANGARLRRLSPGLVIVRPTHFPKSPTNEIVSADVRGTQWMSGRNVTFKELVARAYDYNPGRVSLPPSAPAKNFDFLVTVPANPGEHLRAAIRKKTGYAAHVDTRDMDVLALKVEDPGSPGLKTSVDEKDDVTEKDGRLYFTHQRLSVVTDGLEQMLKTPVVDKTDLTNFYDFSLAWDPQTQRGIQNGTLSMEEGGKILSGWGLSLEPDTASIEVLVVEKAK